MSNYPVGTCAVCQAPNQRLFALSGARHLAGRTWLICLRCFVQVHELCTQVEHEAWVHAPFIQAYQEMSGDTHVTLLPAERALAALLGINEDNLYRYNP